MGHDLFPALATSASPYSSAPVKPFFLCFLPLHSHRGAAPSRANRTRRRLEGPTLKLPKRGCGRTLTLAATVVAAAAAALSLSLTSAPAATAAPAAPAAKAAPAGLSGSDWHTVSLPDPMAPGVPALPSCVPGTSFCLVVGDLDNLGYTAIVTRDGGTSWQHYNAFPADMAYPSAVSCPTTTVCWLADYTSSYTPGVAESTDGGQTWTDMSPGNWPSGRQLWSIDCVSASTCWVAGNDFSKAGWTPVVSETTDGGADWTSFTNLPTIAQYDPNGTYQLNAISCTSALDCVAGGGLNESDGLAQIISTTDGGATWTSSIDPTLAGLQQIFSLSCLNGSNGLPTCYAAADALSAAGPVVISSTDGGATWGGMETYDDTGWMSSISCPDASHCWAAGAGSTVGLVGTADGGNSWSQVTSDTSNEVGTVSCTSVTFCVTTTDNALWRTTNGGGLGAAKPGIAARPASVAAASSPATRRLPKVSGSTVSARAGRSTTVTGQYRGPQSGPASVKITSPTGHVTTTSASIGLNGYYTVTIADTPKGSTKVQVSIGGRVNQAVVVHGYPAAAPTVASLSVHAGSALGGTAVTIKGANFSGVTSVYFGSVAGRDVKVISSKELTVRTPAGSRAVYVTVVTRNGGPSPLTGQSVFNFLARPALTKLSPGSGPARGGTTVTISGSGFAYVKDVYFGTHRAGHLRVVSAREIKVSVPAGTGKVRVTVVTAGGTTPLVSTDYFRY
jgi:hypothetical protein